MITKEEFENIATLARLSADEREYNRLAPDLSAMVAFSDKIKETVLEESEDYTRNTGETLLREDEVKASCDFAEILSNAPCSQDDFFLLRKRA